jgi:thioredoxin 2
MSLSYAACANCGAVNRYDPARRDGAVCGKCKKPLPVSGAVAEVDESGLRKLASTSPLPVVTDFWAPWCGPCLGFAPVFAATALRHVGRIVFVKLDTQKHPGAGQAFGIRGIPTLIAFHDGRELARQSGAMPGAQLEQWLASVTRHGASASG